MPMSAILAAAHPVLPVLTIERREDALPLAQALLRAGISVIEVTLRTACAAQAIADIARELPALCVGAGSVSSASHVTLAADSGARFLVSPGFDEALADACAARDIPLLPGVMTPSEMIRASRMGFDMLKLFPASVAGGMEMLRAVRGPLAQLRFCPTGGVSAANYRDYLALRNVVCVGGSWLAPEKLVALRDWSAITALALAVQPRQDPQAR